MMLFTVAIYMTGLKSGEHATSLIQALGVLQIIWLASGSSGVSQNIGSVQEPTIELLRYKGRYYVCIAEEGHRVSENESRDVDGKDFLIKDVEEGDATVIELHQ
jgi:hypothetical protein